ncbi:MAG: VTC domain-containing protein [Vicinamibacterales bacterium]
MNIRETRLAAREIKFVAPLALRADIIDWARQYMEPDGHGAGIYADEYSTSTLYFETRGFDVYQRRGSYGRSKYRVRQYGASGPVFLERKFRTSQLLAKRRTTVLASDLWQLEGEHPDPAWDGFWFHRRIVLRRLQPLLQLSYDRVARIGMSSTGPVRLTIDANLTALPMPALAFLPGIGMPFLEGFTIIEIKYRATMPAIVKPMVETFRLEVQKISKFRAALRSLDYPLPKDPDEEVAGTVAAVGGDTAGQYWD